MLVITDENDIFQEADFPDYFVDKHHSDDFRLSENPIEPEYIFHELTDHNRLIVRVSIKVSPRTYIPFTFVCDTGAPSFIYINSITRRLIRDRIKTDDRGGQYITINNKNMTVKASPALHEDTNIIGLLALRYFGLFFEENGVGFNFSNIPEFF